MMEKRGLVFTKVLLQHMLGGSQQNTMKDLRQNGVSNISLDQYYECGYVVDQLTVCGIHWKQEIKQ